MSWQDANAIIRLISGLFLWCGVPVSLAAGHRSKKEAKYDLDATFTYWHTHAQERTVLSKFLKDSKKSVISPKEPQPRGRGMICRADKFFAKKMAGGLEPEWPTLRTIAGSPDGYHWAKETSDFDNDTEEEAQEVESDVEHMFESDNSDDSSVQSDCASLHSQHSTTENRDRKRVKRRLKATHSDRATNAKKGIKGRTPDGKKSKVVLSMFRDSKRRWSMPTGELKLRSTSRRVMRITKSRTQCCSPWRERLAGISGIVMNMVTCHLLRSLNGWTCPIMPPWTSGTSMPGCVV